jgi:hypothetical protein
MVALIVEHSAQLILITTPDRPILFTGKGVPRRALMLGGYENEIEALYEAVSKTKHSLTPVVAL